MNNEQIDKLLTELDDIARTADRFEYGLPIGTRVDKAMRSEVRHWLIKQAHRMTEPTEFSDDLAIVIPKEWYA